MQQWLNTHQIAGNVRQYVIIIIHQSATQQSFIFFILSFFLFLGKKNFIIKLIPKHNLSPTKYFLSFYNFSFPNLKFLNFSHKALIIRYQLRFFNVSYAFRNQKIQIIFTTILKKEYCRNSRYFEQNNKKYKPIFCLKYHR